jgi:hypothetical protein
MPHGLGPSPRRCRRARASPWRRRAAPRRGVGSGRCGGSRRHAPQCRCSRRSRGGGGRGTPPTSWGRWDGASGCALPGVVRGARARLCWGPRAMAGLASRRGEAGWTRVVGVEGEGALGAACSGRGWAQGVGGGPGRSLIFDHQKWRTVRP